MDNDVSLKSSQASGGNYDAKLIEMINTAIVDRSPSVKWEDVGKLLRSITYLCFSSSFVFVMILILSVDMQLVLRRQSKH